MTDDARAVNAAVGRHVRRVIHEAGSNLRVAAQRAGLSYRSVLRYMSGERDMPVPVLLALVRASGADLTDLFQQLEAELWPGLAPSDRSAQASDPRESAEVPQAPGPQNGDAATSALHRAQEHLDRRMGELGVARLAARSVGPIGEAELLAIADVVQEIVLELREP